MNKVYVLTISDNVICVADSLEVIEDYLKLDCKQIGTIISTDLFQYKYEDEFNGFLVYQIKAFNKKSNKFDDLFDYKLHVGFMNVVDPENLDYTPY